MNGGVGVQSPSEEFFSAEVSGVENLRVKEAAAAAVGRRTFELSAYDEEHLVHRV